MRPRFVPALLTCGAVVASLTACAAEGNPSGSGGCAPSPVQVEPTSVSPGQEIEIRGQGLWDECNDSNHPQPLGPLTDVPVTFVQPDETRVLATADADADGEITVSVRVPPDAAPGDATVALGTASETVPITVVP